MIKKILLLICLFSSTAFASQKINLGVESINYYPIYGSFDANDNEVGEYSGFVADIFRLYNKVQNDFEVVFQPRPVKRLFSEFLTDNSTLDAKFPDNAYWAEDLKKGKKIIYSDPFMDYTDGAFVLKENKAKPISNIKSMGTIAGFTPFDYLKEIESGKIKTEESSNTSSLIEKLLKRRVDAIYINKFIGICKSSKVPNADQIVFDDSLPHIESKYFLSSIKYPKFIISFNEFMKKHKDDVNKIKKDYMDKCK